jgi:hypothetical protein
MDRLTWIWTRIPLVEAKMLKFGCESCSYTGLYLYIPFFYHNAVTDLPLLDLLSKQQTAHDHKIE